MTSCEYDVLVAAAAQRYANAAGMVQASLRRYHPFDVQRAYSAEELEPYDAMCDCYLRAVEMAIRYFRTVERSRLALLLRPDEVFNFRHTGESRYPVLA